VLRGRPYEQAFLLLDAEHIAALHALAAAGGWLPRVVFEHHFGVIRLYRPWRRDFGPRHPWRYPVSVAERLYHLGFIHLESREMVRLVAEAAALLPPLPRPHVQAVQFAPPVHDAGRLALLRDLSVLLGTLMQVRAQPVHERWLPLSVMRLINERLNVPEDLTEVRSTLQAGRLRWLHYLALTAGLLAVQHKQFTPTMAAWRWFSASPSDQWEQLMQAVARDLGARQRLWDAFRFPAVSAATWRAVRHLLDDLSPAHAYRVRDILAMLTPHLLNDTPYAIACLLREMFVWSGVIVMYRGRLFVRQGFGPAGIRDEAVAVTYEEDVIRVHLPAAASAELAQLLAIAHVEGQYALITAESAREAVRQGLDTDAIITLLASLSGRPVPRRAYHTIRAWMQAAVALRLEPAVLLHATDPATISRIRSDWRLAEHIVQRLTPHHLAVKSETVEKLLSRLNRRGLQVTSLVSSRKTREDVDTLTPSMAEYLLLAVRTYQKLQTHLKAGILIPKAVSHWLSPQVVDATSIEREATTLAEAVQKRVPQPQLNADGAISETRWIRDLLIVAQQRHVPIMIDYHSPYHDEMMTRTIHVKEVYDVNELTYIDAYCDLVGEQRTFRLDRVLRVYEPLAHDQVI